MVDGIVVAIQGVHGLQLFKGHAAFSAITLFSGFGPLELGAGGLLKKKSRVLAFHQLLDFIIKALDGSILRQFSLTDEINQQRLNSGVVFGLCTGQGQFNRIADFQVLQFSGVIRVLLLVIGLKLCDLILKGLGVTRSLLQRFKLGVTLFDCDMALRMTKDVFNFTFWSDEFYLKKATEVWNRVKDMGKVAYFFRDDVEKFYDLQTDYDLSAAFSPNMTAAECQFATVLMLSVVDRFDVIVTDRLHVGIAAILMNKEVYLFDNNYGKISAVYEHSFSAMKNVHLCCEADWLRIQKLKNESIDNLSLLLNAMRVDV